MEENLLKWNRTTKLPPIQSPQQFANRANEVMPKEHEQTNNTGKDLNTNVSTTRKRKTPRRKNFTTFQAQALEHFFQQNPYPTIDEYESIAAYLKLPKRRVIVSFQNQRARRKAERQLVPITYNTRTEGNQ